MLPAPAQWNSGRYDHLLTLVRSHAARYLEGLAWAEATPRYDEEALRTAFDSPFPEHSCAPEDVVEELVAAVTPALVNSAGPHYFGFVVGGALPVTVAAEWLTTAWDQCSALYALSPAAAVVEDACAAWLVDLFGLPPRTTTGFTSGCQSANLSGLAAARYRQFARFGWNVNDRGLVGAPEPLVLMSSNCHATVRRALRWLGLGGQVVEIECNDQGVMDLEAFRRALPDSDTPLIVCVQAGATDTGAVDPVGTVVDLTHQRGGWVHVDGAFGLWALASERYGALLRGVERADSLATDGHKWLNVPYDCGMVFCADEEAHLAGSELHEAHYLMPDRHERRDSSDWSPELSKRARSFVVWAALRHLGRRGLAELVERCCDLARHARDRLGAHEGVLVLNDVLLNQVLVRFQNNLDDEAHTELVISTLQRTGPGWASGTTWRGQRALRLSVSNWATRQSHVDVCVDLLLKAHHDLRAAALVPHPASPVELLVQATPAPTAGTDPAELVQAEVIQRSA